MPKGKNKSHFVIDKKGEKVLRSGGFSKLVKSDVIPPLPKSSAKNSYHYVLGPDGKRHRKAGPYSQISREKREAGSLFTQFGALPAAPVPPALPKKTLKSRQEMLARLAKGKSPEERKGLFALDSTTLEKRYIQIFG